MKILFEPVVNLLHQTKQFQWNLKKTSLQFKIWKT